MERVSSTKFLGVHITEDLTWTTNTMSLSRSTTAPTLSSAGWKEQVSHHPSSPHSTGAPLKSVADQLHHCLVRELQCFLTARPSSGQWTQMQRSSVPLSHPSWTFSLHDAPAKPTASWRTPSTVSSSSYHQEDVPEHQSPLLQAAQQLFSPGCESPEPKSPLPPETWTIKQTPPNLTTPKKKTVWTFFVQFKCATHRWVGLYKPPVVTHSPLCALDTFPHFSCVYTIPQKTQQYMYVYMLMHYYKSSCTVPQPAAWLTMFLSAHVQYLCEAFA